VGIIVRVWGLDEPPHILKHECDYDSYWITEEKEKKVICLSRNRRREE
jgi:hypothetical protein